MQGLDATIEHLRRARDRGDVGDRQARFAQRSCSATGRDQLEPAVDQATPEVDQIGLVGHREERPAWRRERGVGAVEVDRDVPARVDRQRTSRQEGDGAGQQAMLDRLDPLMQARDVVTAQDRDRLLDDDRAAVERGVHEVDGRTRDGRSVVEGVAHRVRTREGRQQRGMDVDDPAGECRQHARPDHPHVPRQHDDVGAGTRQHIGQRRVVAARDGCGIDPLLHRPVERGARPIGEHQDDLAAELATTRGRVQRSQVGPGARHADDDARAHLPLLAHATDSSRPSR